jgi:hypothetical protein
VAARAVHRPVLGACACSRRLRGDRVNIGVVGARGPIGRKWQRPAFHLREVRMVMAVLIERYGLLAVAAAGFWRGATSSA